MGSVNVQALLMVVYWLYDAGAITRDEYGHVYQRLTEAEHAGRAVGMAPHPDELREPDE